MGLAIRWWWLLFLGAAAAGVAAYVVSERTTLNYSATAKILVQGARTPGSPSAIDIQANRQLAEDLSAIVNTRSIMDSVLDDLGLAYSPATLAEKVQTSSSRNVLAIAAVDPDAVVAADIANRTAQNFIEDFQRRQLSQIAQFQASILQYGIELDAALIAAQASTITALSLIEEAIPPPSPISRRTRLNVVLAMIAGLIAAGVVVMLKEYLDDTVKSMEDVKEITDAPTLNSPSLASIERLSSRDGAPTLLRESAGDGFAEAYRFLATNLEFALLSTPRAKHLVIASSRPMEGKTTTAANLAITLARQGKSIIVVDLDVHKPGLHLVFGENNTLGVTDVVLGHAELDEVLIRTSVDGLALLPSGPVPPDASRMLRSERMRELMNSLSDRADLVIFDSAPLLSVVDVLVMSSIVDGIIVVVDAERTGKRTLRSSMATLSQSQAPVLGVVLNKVSTKNRAYGYQYDHYYSASDGDSQNGDALWWRRLRDRSGNLVRRVRGRLRA